jgi:hypothetical protein
VGSRPGKSRIVRRRDHADNGDRGVQQHLQTGAPNRPIAEDSKFHNCKGSGKNAWRVSGMIGVRPAKGLRERVA